MSRIRKRHFGVLFLLLLVAAGVAGGWAWQRYRAFAETPVGGLSGDERLLIEQGDSFNIVLVKLREAGIQAGHRLQWRLLARQLGAADSLHVGEYALQPGATPTELLVAMREGDIIQHSFTIIEGWNIRDLRAALARARPLEHETGELDAAGLMQVLGHAGEHPEGRFLPETYLYTRGDSDLDLLRRAYAAMQEALAAAWQQRDPDTQLESPYELLILASIVEKETAAIEERPRIAGVFERRLERGMKLQTDPTVIYGMGAGYDGNISRSDLTTDTPYNTYTNAGLPPTPIAMPGVGALTAAAHPAPGEALFFVAIGDGSGRHRFARTLAGHQANVRKYLAQYRRNQREADDKSSAQAQAAAARASGKPDVAQDDSSTAASAKPPASKETQDP